MKTRTSPGWFPVLILTAALTLAARNVAAQNSTASAAQTAPVQLSYGVSQIIQLSQAKISNDTIVNYIRHSGSSYGLDAGQIVYLKQQGVSDTVINTMLSQPRLTQTVVLQPAPATSSSTATVATQPTATYVQTVPASTVYVIPDTQTYNYYAYSYRPYYGGYYYPAYSPYCYYSGWYYPAVTFSVGFGGGYHGVYYRGGWGGYHGVYYHGGYRGGGGWHH